MFTETIRPAIDYSAHSLKTDGRDIRVDCYVGYKTCDEAPRRPAVVIFPGGGYAGQSPREAEPIALTFAAQGYAAFVLWYTVKPGEFPCALLEAAWTVNFVREHADEWNIDPKKVLVCGFSAGGHLAASIGTLWNSPEVRDILGFKNREGRPDGMVLCYPVISSGEFIEHGSFQNLLGSRSEDLELRSRLSLENAVDSETPPAFIWHTAEDSLVPVENSLLMATALSKHSIPFELHIIPFGYHGLALSRPETGEKKENMIPWVTEWPKFAAQWFDTVNP